jgi:hypothetical protein
MPRKVITEELKQEIIKYYLSQPMTMKQVEDKYELSHPTITKILKDIPKYSKAKLNNPNMNERLFEDINSEENAYFLGLLISDGNVFKDNTGRQASISITLDLKDKYILEKFKEVVNSNTAICYDGRGCGQIAVRSNLMAEDLAKYGVVPRKSYNTYLPKISDKWMSHLIRGIFDGDGSIMAKPNPKNDGHNRFLHSISFCGSHELMTNISDYAFEKLHLKQKPTVYDYADRKLSEIKIQNIDDMAKFGYWMYYNSSIFLNRKKDIFNNFLSHYNDTLIEQFNKEYECIWN